VTGGEIDVKLREALKCEVIVRSASASGRDRRDAVPASESTHLRPHVSYNNDTPELETIVPAYLFQGSRGQLWQVVWAHEL
jgi:hypothetical protein